MCTALSCLVCCWREIPWMKMFHTAHWSHSQPSWTTVLSGPETRYHRLQTCMHLFLSVVYLKCLFVQYSYLQWNFFCSCHVLITHLVLGFSSPLIACLTEMWEIPVRFLYSLKQSCISQWQLWLGCAFPGARESRTFSIPIFPGMKLTQYPGTCGKANCML